jgi:hypothetical protein
MENNSSLKEEAGDYIETRIKIIKLKAIDKGGAAISGVISAAALALFGFFILLFLSLSAAYAVAAITGMTWLGFLSVALFYVLLAVLLVKLKEKLITMPVINALLKKFYYKDKKED